LFDLRCSSWLVRLSSDARDVLGDDVAFLQEAVCAPVADVKVLACRPALRVAEVVQGVGDWLTRPVCVELAR